MPASIFHAKHQILNIKYFFHTTFSMSSQMNWYVFNATAIACNHIVLTQKPKLPLIRNVFGKTNYEVDLEWHFQEEKAKVFKYFSFSVISQCFSKPGNKQFAVSGRWYFLQPIFFYIWVKQDPCHNAVLGGLWSIKNRWAPYNIFRLFCTSRTCTPKSEKAPFIWNVGSKNIFQSQTRQGP